MKKGFTLLELMIVVIIIGILAGLAVPQFIRAAERARSAEGAHILGVIRGSQTRYKAQHGEFGSDCGELDVDIPTLRYFNDPPTCFAASGNNTTIVSITRDSGVDNDVDTYGDYTLEIDASGTISCSGGATNTTCKAVGYSD